MKNKLYSILLVVLLVNCLLITTVYAETSSDVFDLNSDLEMVYNDGQTIIFSTTDTVDFPEGAITVYEEFYTETVIETPDGEFIILSEKEAEDLAAFESLTDEVSALATYTIKFTNRVAFYTTGKMEVTVQATVTTSSNITYLDWMDGSVKVWYGGWNAETIRFYTKNLPGLKTISAGANGQEYWSTGDVLVVDFEVYTYVFNGEEHRWRDTPTVTVPRL